MHYLLQSLIFLYAYFAIHLIFLVMIVIWSRLPLCSSWFLIQLKCCIVNLILIMIMHWIYAYMDLDEAFILLYGIMQSVALVYFQLHNLLLLCHWQTISFKSHRTVGDYSGLTPLSSCIKSLNLLRCIYVLLPHAWSYVKWNACCYE